jgi:hypothetical protein
VAEGGRGVEDRGHQRRVAGDAAGEQVRRGLRVAHLVGRDQRQQLGEHGVGRLLADAPEEVRREVLGEHELDEPFDERAGRPGAPRRLARRHELRVGDARLVADGVEVGAQRVEVLEPLVELERHRDAALDVVPELVEHPAEVHGVEALDERRVAELREQVGARRGAGRVDVRPPDVALHRPVPAVGGGREARVGVRERGARPAGAGGRRGGHARGGHAGTSLGQSLGASWAIRPGAPARRARRGRARRGKRAPTVRPRRRRTRSPPRRRRRGGCRRRRRRTARAG